MKFNFPVSAGASWSAALLALAVGCTPKEAPSHGASPPASSAPVARAPAPSSSASQVNTTAGTPGDKGETKDARGARGANPPANANVVLITIDSLRADMPWAGYARPIAPRLTELASKAVVYTHAYATSSYTSMSLGGLLAGRYPSELKRDGYFFGTYAKDNVLFPELLKDRGVHTMAGHAHGYFKNAGFEQGFDNWEIVSKLKWNNTTDENITSPELYAIAEKQLSSAALEAEDARFFAWYHFLDPHDRYLAHDSVPPYGKTLRDKYDAEVTFTDGYVGKLYDFIQSNPWGARTIVIVSSDHGEAFGEHNQFGHGFELWENLIRVPLLVLAPGAAPRRVDAIRSHVDLAPTILEVFGATPAPGMRGTSLIAEVYGPDAPSRDAFIDLPITSDNDRRRALVMAGSTKKVISYSAQGLKRIFDLEADPTEEHPITVDAAKDAAKEAVDHFNAVEKSLVEIPATSCKEGCVMGGYARKDGGS